MNSWQIPTETTLALRILQLRREILCHIRESRFAYMVLLRIYYSGILATIFYIRKALTGIAF